MLFCFRSISNLKFIVIMLSLLLVIDSAPQYAEVDSSTN